MFPLLSEKCACIRYQACKVGLKKKCDDVLHYEIRRINYPRNADIKQMWDAATSSDADLSWRVFSCVPFGKSHITEEGKSDSGNKGCLCFHLQIYPEKPLTLYKFGSEIIT